MKVSQEQAGERLDRYLTAAELGLTRARIKKLIDDGRALVNGVVAKASMKLKGGEEVTLDIPEPKPLDLLPEKIDLDIVYEDKDIVVVNKPAGMVTHPAVGHSSGTLVHALLAHCTDLSGIGGVTRPGIVHRLDKDTSGLIVAAKNDGAHLALSSQLESRELSRIYIAIVKGYPKPASGVVEGNIGRHPRHRQKMAVLKEGGRASVSRYKTLQELEGASVVEVSLETGRTHQVRVHMQSINCPVLGDPVYSRGVGKYPIKRQALHAWRMKLVHPSTGDTMEFKAQLPDDMAKLIIALNGDPEPLLG